MDPENNRSRLAVIYPCSPAQDRTPLQVSLEDQERLYRRWARNNSWRIVEYIRETTCGSATNLGLQRLQELLNERAEEGCRCG